MAGLVVLGACAQPTPQAGPVEIAQARYVSSAPPSLTLVTSIRNADDSGAHSALIINGPERVVFNPAGSWRHPLAPERGDVHYGFTPGMENWFFNYHARITYRIKAQTLEVPPEVAAQALALVQQVGSVGPARCTLSITGVLRQLPGFEDFPMTWRPRKAERSFDAYPGVVTRLYVDDSPDDWSDLDLEFND
ncbi:MULTISPECIES: hypothetical protein [unclassified Meridianimarinicoccus]|uniref:hypothetical protein n=1 Tax=unclassified Meridianimarinicoccus TaxID=2923344 RepID=UPI001868A40F|nr:hypothetical protein [Fluviibacterium sp. MJW13]